MYEYNDVEIDLNDNTQEIWINPVGGMGDALMLSSVLKMVNNKFPLKKFNIIRRSRFNCFFRNHPAVSYIGNPHSNAVIINSMFWKGNGTANSELGSGNKRPFQQLAVKFGLEVPVEEKFYFPNTISDDIIYNIIPWKKKNILFAPTSDSRKKNMSPVLWTELYEKLKSNDRLIMQTGVPKDFYIKGTYCLIDLTTPGELISLLKKCDLLVTADSFVMHAAHYAGTSAIVIWGPTFSEEFGYPEHIHIRPDNECELINPCMGRKGCKEINRYHEPCHLPPEKHCLNSIDVNKIINYADSILNE